MPTKKPNPHEKKKVKGLGEAGQWRQAISEVESAVEGGLPPDEYVYGSCVGAVANSGRWEEALDVLRRMRRGGVAPTTPVYNAAIKACARGGQLKLALALLEEMQFNAAKAAAADGASSGAPAAGNSSRDRAGGASGSNVDGGTGTGPGRLVQENKRDGLERISSGARLNGLGGGGSSGSGGSRRSGRRGRRKAATSPSSSCDPDIQTINTVMSACARAGRWELALEVMKKAQRQDGIHPTRVTYNTAISACGRGGEVDQAVRLLREMRAAGLAPDAISFNSAIAACASRGQWKRALSLLAEMEAVAADGGDGDDEAEAEAEAGEGGARRRGLPDAYSFGSAIAACGRGGQWSLAVGLLSTMRRKGIAPGVVAFNAAISACGEAGQWERAVGLLRDMEAEAGERREVDGGGGGDDGFSGPDRVSFNAAINACSNAGEWQQAVSLLAEMQRNAKVADGGDQGAEPAVRPEGEMKQHRRRRGRAGGPTPDVVSYSTVITACSRAGNWERALELLGEMRRDDGLSPNSATFTTLIAAWRKDWGYGGEGASEPEARGALVPLLDSMKACGVTPDRRLYASALDALGDASLCERARAMFAEMSAAGIPADEGARSAVASACSAGSAPAPR